MNFHGISDGFYWLIIVAGLLILFIIPSPQKNDTLKKIPKQILPELKYPFALPKLDYAYKALEPYIDEQTMKIHYTKHHQGYVDQLNKVMENYPEYHKYSLEELIFNLEVLPTELKQTILSYGGGHFNHTLFWKIMNKSSNNKPSETLLFKFQQAFQSFENFKQDFIQKALSIIGSGWVWLCIDKNGELKTVAKYNHETPLQQKLTPILILDVWEHAYYLKYQNNRANYINAWWNVVDWKAVEKLYAKQI